MSGGTAAGWYPDPHDPAHTRYWNGTEWAAPLPVARVSDTGRVFAVTWVYCIVIGLITGLGSGTVVVPVIGTIFGGVLGLVVGVGVGVIIAAVLAAAARPAVSSAAYRLTVDITLGIVGIASTAFALLWAYSVTDELRVRGAVAIFAFAVICLVAVRPRLRKLVPE